MLLVFPVLLGLGEVDVSRPVLNLIKLEDFSQSQFKHRTTLGFTLYNTTLKIGTVFSARFVRQDQISGK